MASDTNTMYPMNLVFDMRLMAENEGETRPTVVALAWNHNSIDCDERMDQMIAIASARRTRVFGKFDTGTGHEWKMLFNRVHCQGGETRDLQWNSQDGQILAIGSDVGAHLVIDLLKWKGHKFEIENRIKVASEGFLSTLCWQDLDQYLLLTVDPSNGIEAKATMIIVKDPIKSPAGHFRQPEVIVTNYEEAICAAICPDERFIFTTSASSSNIYSWAEDETNGWRIVQTIRCPIGITKMCFNHDGSRLAAIGQQLIIWTSSFKLKGNKNMLQLTRLPKTENADSIGSRRRGVTLKEHCENLISLHFSSDGNVVTGSSRGSICIHGAPKTRPGKNQKSLEVLGFQWCDVQQYYADGEIKCVGSEQGTQWIASGGSDGIVIIWRVFNRYRPQSERNSNIDCYCYSPGWIKIKGDDTINMEPDCPAFELISTDRSSADGMSEGNSRSEDLEDKNDPTIAPNVEKGQSTPKVDVDKRDKELTLSDILVEIVSLQTKQRDVAMRLDQTQGKVAEVASELQDICDSVNLQDAALTNIVQQLSKKNGH